MKMRSVSTGVRMVSDLLPGTGSQVEADMLTMLGMGTAVP